MPNSRTIVRTNSIPGSIKDVQLRVVTFQELWDNYPSGNPYDNSAYKDQCAIRMSVMFHRVGIEMKSFSENSSGPCRINHQSGGLSSTAKPRPLAPTNWENG